MIRTPSHACPRLLVLCVGVSCGATSLRAQADSDALTPPPPVAFLDRSATSITLGFEDRSSDELGFTVERRSGDGWRRVHIVLEGRASDDSPLERGRSRGTHHTIRDTDLTPDTYYCYRIVALDGRRSARSPERCFRTLPDPPVVHMNKRPSWASKTLPSDLFDMGVQDVVPCTDPLLQARLEELLDMWDDLPPELRQRIEMRDPCDGPTWGFGDITDLLGDIWDQVKKAECAAAIAATATACGGEVVACLGALGGGGGPALVQGCYEDELGDEHCTDPSVIEGGGGMLACLGAIGLFIQGEDPCTLAAKWAESACGGDED